MTTVTLQEKPWWVIHDQRGNRSVKREGESWWSFEVSPVTWKALIITCIVFDQRPLTIGTLSVGLSRVTKRLKPRRLTNCRISRQDRDVTHFNILYILVRADKNMLGERKVGNVYRQVMLMGIDMQWKIELNVVYLCEFMDQEQRSSAIVLLAGLGKSENTDGSRRWMAIASYRFSDQINITILRRDAEQDATRRCKRVARNRKVSKRPYCDSAEWRKRRKGAVKRIHAFS